MQPSLPPWRLSPRHHHNTNIGVGHGCRIICSPAMRMTHGCPGTRSLLPSDPISSHLSCCPLHLLPPPPNPIQPRSPDDPFPPVVSSIPSPPPPPTNQLPTTTSQTRAPVKQDSGFAPHITCSRAISMTCGCPGSWPLLPLLATPPPLLSLFPVTPLIFLTPNTPPSRTACDTVAADCSTFDFPGEGRGGCYKWILSLLSGALHTGWNECMFGCTLCVYTHSLKLSPHLQSRHKDHLWLSRLQVFAAL